MWRLTERAANRRRPSHEECFVLHRMEKSSERDRFRRNAVGLFDAHTVRRTPNNGLGEVDQPVAARVDGDILFCHDPIIVVENSNT